MCAHLIFFGTLLSFSSSFHGKHRPCEAEFFFFFKCLTKKCLHDLEEKSCLSLSLSFFCAFGTTIFFPFFYGLQL